MCYSIDLPHFNRVVATLNFFKNNNFFPGKCVKLVFTSRHGTVISVSLISNCVFVVFWLFVGYIVSLWFSLYFLYPQSVHFEIQLFFFLLTT